MNIEKSKVSIIVPVHNNEKRLDRCIESLTNQTFGDLEIILVDDGSQDRSGIICDQWKEKDERIVVIHQKNAGVGAARNKGLSVAHGKWVAFVDSDDYVDKRMYELLVLKAEKEGTMQVCCNVYNVFRNSTEKESHCFENQRIEGNKKIHSEIILSLLTPEQANNKAKLLQALWNKLYLREIIEANNIRFDEELPYAEDWLFNVNYYRFVDCIAFITEHLYYYDRTTEGSLSKTFRWDGFNNSIKIRKKQREWFPDSCTKEVYQKLVLKIERHNLNAYVRYSGYKDFRKYTRFLYENENLREVYQSMENVPGGHRIAKICLSKSKALCYERLYYIQAIFVVSVNALKYYIKKIIK